ncbi:NAD(P)-dependent dehydrogenase (short-subunit alcohol dehydrogenase family) [Filimonas zeae]|uniref:Short-chain dehydrogenase n=1 Tax=Filimonas zeae TaxID=1737353 RepID=A0A917IS98_9BACT|nr:SDR family oxidoreductase [Filimonas zeae]MDR6338136.1 NAD(P)-dependent dehydrogenase (short-subunit alcohol dehydrogenase family) [Filimonas zeae]GGH61898.1 short-chain dehydrogenase [Filimonas zeae]
MAHTTKLNTDLTGKTALVTGGTKGIGKAIADELAAAGARVIISARNAPSAESTHHFIAADLTNAQQASSLARQINDEFGGIDMLINNVGGLTTPGGGYSALTDKHWEDELQLNLIAAIRLDREFIPVMTARRNAVIIHISSIAARQALWNLNLAYAVSKSALNSYSKALATELASKGVRVLTVSPGATKTPPMEKFIADYAAAQNIPEESALAQLLQQTGGIPMGRMAEPEEVASLVHYLVSPAASYLTGSIYAIDGGALPVVS